MNKKAKAPGNKKKLKIKDLTAGRKAGGVKGGQGTTTPQPRVTKKLGNSWMVPCV